jgi:HTH-type transcriptional regulator / antitoxin HipB
MVKNERQYKIAKVKLENWSKTLAQLPNNRRASTNWLAKEQAFGVGQQINQLRAEIAEYDETASGKRKLPDLGLVSEIPSTLISWRIAHHLTQRELAERVGIHENQLQKYEAEDYGCASYQTIAHMRRFYKKRARSVTQSLSERGHVANCYTDRGAKLSSPLRL